MALINIQDVVKYRRIAPDFQQERFDAFLLQIQEINLRQFLGSQLYKLLIDAYPDNGGNYSKLIDGCNYTYNGETINYFGLKPVLVYWWLAIATREGEMFLSDYGAVEFVNNTQQNYEKSKAAERIATSYMQTAENYLKDVVKYLSDNRSTYPSYSGNGTVANNQDFVMFRV